MLDFHRRSASRQTLRLASPVLEEEQFLPGFPSIHYNALRFLRPLPLALTGN